MVVEVAVAVSFTTIVVASLRFARRLLADERAEYERQERDDAAAEAAAREAAQPKPPPPPPSAPLPPYWKSVTTTLDAVGCSCSFCGITTAPGALTWSARPIYSARGALSVYEEARTYLQKNKHEIAVSGPHTVDTDEGPRVFLCCLRCQGEWLAVPAAHTSSASKKRSKVPS